MRQPGGCSRGSRNNRFTILALRCTAGRTAIGTTGGPILWSTRPRSSSFRRGSSRGKGRIANHWNVWRHTRRGDTFVPVIIDSDRPSRRCSFRAATTGHGEVVFAGWRRGNPTRGFRRSSTPAQDWTKSSTSAGFPCQSDFEGARPRSSTTSRGRSGQYSHQRCLHVDPDQRTACGHDQTVVVVLDEHGVSGVEGAEEVHRSAAARSEVGIEYAVAVVAH